MTNIESISFLTLPGPDHYEGVILDITKEVRDTFGASAYLHMIRKARKHNRSFDEFLHLGAKHAIDLEDKDERGMTVDPLHQKANSFLSGLIFANLINEAIFSDIVPSETIKYIDTNPTLTADEVKAIKLHGGINTPRGLRIGFQAVSRVTLSDLKQTSVEHIQEWSVGAIRDVDKRPNFMIGVGVGVFAGYEFFRNKYDALLEGGDYERIEEVESDNPDQP